MLYDALPHCCLQHLATGMSYRTSQRSITSPAGIEQPALIVTACQTAVPSALSLALTRPDLLVVWAFINMLSSDLLRWPGLLQAQHCYHDQLEQTLGMTMVHQTWRIRCMSYCIVA